MAKKRNHEEASIEAGSNDTSGKGFTDPPADDSLSSGMDSGFEDPDSEASSEGVSPSAEMLGTRQTIEAALARFAGSEGASHARARDAANVLGVGISTGSGSDTCLPGEPCLIVFVENETDQDAVRAEICDDMGASALSDDAFPLEVVTTGPIEALTSNRSRFRPSSGGLSVGHPQVTAGTLGGWARGNGARSTRLLMVSNNHVLANSNQARFQDPILQPGTADGGRSPADRIAILERFVNIAFGGPANYVDAATGWCWPALVKRDHLYHVGSSPRYFRVGARSVEPRVNMMVGKTGRTTNLTNGRVTAIGVSVNVNYGGGKVAHFRDQFAVRSPGASPFSAGGDSGSFVWTWDSLRCPVGLLFAGGGGTTFCNRITRVISALDITLL